LHFLKLGCTNAAHLCNELETSPDGMRGSHRFHILSGPPDAGEVTAADVVPARIR